MRNASRDINKKTKNSSEEWNDKTNDKGYNLAYVSTKNRLLVLKEIALYGPISRVTLASALGLTKAALSKIVAELLSNHLISEISPDTISGCNTPGRKPILLKISEHSPCVCGILINRHRIAGIIADLSCHVVEKEVISYESLNSEEDLLEHLLSLYHTLISKNSRQVEAVSIASLGPIDDENGKILSPFNFYGIHNMEICRLLEDQIGRPCFLINDANAGALAEKMYGFDKSASNFIYLNIMNGIGSGYILDHKLYRGENGQSGEIGHSSINFSGPQCDCGNIGCLELYANNRNMNSKIRQMQSKYGVLGTLPHKTGDYSFDEILCAAERHDPYALTALDEFCNYLSVAVLNVIRFLNISTIVIGYDSASDKQLLEKTLFHLLHNKMDFAQEHSLIVRHSTFDGNAPLYGAIARAADLVFEGKLNWLNGTDENKEEIKR